MEKPYEKWGISTTFASTGFLAVFPMPAEERGLQVGKSVCLVVPGGGSTLDEAILKGEFYEDPK